MLIFISHTNYATKNKNKLNSEYFIPNFRYFSTFIFLNFTSTIHSTNSTINFPKRKYSEKLTKIFISITSQIYRYNSLYQCLGNVQVLEMSRHINITFMYSNIFVSHYWWTQSLIRKSYLYKFYSNSCFTVLCNIQPRGIGSE